MPKSFNSVKKCLSPDCLCHRRQFLKILTLGTITGSFWLQKTGTAKALAKTKALVLSCIDFRFVNIEHKFLQDQNLDNQYDWLSLAGASLALSGFPSAAETTTFWEELDLSYRLHNIENVIILDHQDCGAYANKIDFQLASNPQREKEVHIHYLTQAYSSIKKRYPKLEIELYFVKLDGQVEKIENLPL